MTDTIDQLLINALMEDSRRSLKALAQISGLSAPSVGERLRRLEERGVLRGYTVDVDPRSFGYQLQAIVRIRPLPGQLQEVERQIIAIPEFTECDKVTGEDCFIARLHVRSMEQLDILLDRINVLAVTNTAIIKKPQSNVDCRRWTECMHKIDLQIFFCTHKCHHRCHFCVQDYSSMPR